MSSLMDLFLILVSVFCFPLKYYIKQDKPNNFNLLEDNLKK